MLGANSCVCVIFNKWRFPSNYSINLIQWTLLFKELEDEYIIIILWVFFLAWLFNYTASIVLKTKMFQSQDSVGKNWQAM